MKKRILSLLLVFALLSLSSCSLFHRHELGEWQYRDLQHYRACSCGYTLAENLSGHIDENHDDECDLCRCSLKYEINSLYDLSWYLLYYYELSEYAYLEDSNMKPHSLHSANFSNTLTYNEKYTRVAFEYPDFNEYLPALPMHEAYVKSGTEYYSYHQGSGYSQTDVPAKYYSFRTQENIRYGRSDELTDYERFTETKSNFKEVNVFYETLSSSHLTKTVYPNASAYDENNLSFKNDILSSVTGKISYFLRYYLNVDMQEGGELILPELSYFDRIDVKTENGIVYFTVEKQDGNTFFGEDIRYSISGTIDLRTHRLSYNVKESYYSDGEITYYVDYDYSLSLTSDPIDIDFDFSGEFEEVYMENR